MPIAGSALVVAVGAVLLFTGAQKVVQGTKYVGHKMVQPFHKHKEKVNAKP